MKKGFKRNVRRVAVLVGTSTGWGRGVIRGICRHAQVCGNWILYVDPKGMDEDFTLPSGWVGDGVIARISDETVYRSIRASGLPCVNVSAIGVPGSEDFPRITTDHASTARLAFSHFHEKGFRSFGYFGLFNVPYIVDHTALFVNEAVAAGCPCSVYSAPVGSPAAPDWSVSLPAVGAWLKTLPKPCGVLAWNVNSCQCVIHAAQQIGLHVPEDVAVLSAADDDFLCEIAHIPVSAIRLQTEKIGTAAAEYLDRMMAGETIASGTVTMFGTDELVVRQSTDTLAVNDDAVIRAMAFIREHACDHKVGVDEVADATGVCRRTLEVRFVTAMNRTVHEEIRQTRLERARRLLHDTELTIDRVAERSGFGTPEHFSFLFRKMCGVTPRQYRRESR